MIQDRFSLLQSRFMTFVTGYYRELISGLLGLIVGLTLAWLVWPVKWEGALPADILAEYKILIANGIAEDHMILAQEAMNPGAEKILGYLSPDGSLPAVNEALALLRDSEELKLRFQEGEKKQIEANLLSLQSLLIELTSTPNFESVPTSATSRETSEVTGQENQWTRFLSWFSILVLIGGCIWISYRMIMPRTEPKVETVRFNADMEIEEYDEEEEEETTSSNPFWSRFRVDRSSREDKHGDVAPFS